MATKLFGLYPLYLLRGLPALSVPASAFSGEWTRQPKHLVCGTGQPCQGPCLVSVPAADGGWPHLPVESARRGSPYLWFEVNTCFLAQIDPAQNAARLTVGNASPDEGTSYGAMWFSGQYIFEEDTCLLYQGESEGVGCWGPWCVGLQ